MKLYRVGVRLVFFHETLIEAKSIGEAHAWVAQALEKPEHLHTRIPPDWLVPVLEAIDEGSPLADNKSPPLMVLVGLPEVVDMLRVTNPEQLPWGWTIEECPFGPAADGFVTVADWLKEPVARKHPTRANK